MVNVMNPSIHNPKVLEAFIHDAYIIGGVGLGCGSVIMISAVAYRALGQEHYGKPVPNGELTTTEVNRILLKLQNPASYNNESIDLNDLDYALRYHFITQEVKKRYC